MNARESSPNRILKIPVPPKLEGYMDKLKHHSPFILSSWTHRYFRVNVKNGTLEYFHKLKEESIEYSRVPLKSFPMTDIQHVYSIDDLSFQIDMLYQQSLILRTKSTEEKKRWIMALSSYVVALRVN